MENLYNRIKKIDAIIDEYTILSKKTNISGIKKNYEFFITHLIKQKVDIQELMAEIKETELIKLGFL